MRSVRPPSLLSLLLFSFVVAATDAFAGSARADPRQEQQHEQQRQEQQQQATPAQRRAQLFVEWGGSWWAADVLERTKDGRARIHYIDWGSEWDETVDASRIKRRASSPGRDGRSGKSRLFVEWGGSWWQATILASEGDGRVRIHYDGWGKEWDETVDASRLLRLE